MKLEKLFEPIDNKTLLDALTQEESEFVECYCKVLNEGLENHMSYMSEFMHENDLGYSNFYTPVYSVLNYSSLCFYLLYCTEEVKSREKLFMTLIASLLNSMCFLEEDLVKKQGTPLIRYFWDRIDDYDHAGVLKQDGITLDNEMYYRKHFITEPDKRISPHQFFPQDPNIERAIKSVQYFEKFTGSNWGAILALSKVFLEEK